MPPILNAQNISKRFGAKPLFQDISFAVHDGARIGLIGPNGAGKSTLLAMLAGEQEPDTGDIAFRTRARRTRACNMCAEFVTLHSCNSPCLRYTAR